MEVKIRDYTEHRSRLKFVHKYISLWQKEGEPFYLYRILFYLDALISNHTNKLAKRFKNQIQDFFTIEDIYHIGMLSTIEVVSKVNPEKLEPRYIPAWVVLKFTRAVIQRIKKLNLGKIVHTGEATADIDERDSSRTADCYGREKDFVDRLCKRLMIEDVMNNGALTEKQKEALKLYFYEGREMKQIAEEKGVAVKAVRKRLSGGLKNICKGLIKKYKDSRMRPPQGLLKMYHFYKGGGERFITSRCWKRTKESIEEGWCK